MLTSKERILQVLVLSLILLIITVQPARGAEVIILTLPEALEEAFAANETLALFRVEQALLAQQDKLAQYPQVNLSAEPGRIKEGVFLGPVARLNLALPLKEGLTLEGALSGALTETGVDVQPVGTLTLKYDFLAPPKITSHSLEPDDKLRAEQNDLVLQIFELFVSLRTKLEEELLSQERLALFELQLEAAKLIADYDEKDLTKAYVKEKESLRILTAEISQLQMDLADLLGSTNSIYRPVLEYSLEKLELDEQKLSEDFLTASTVLNKAKADLAKAQDLLLHEEKTRGWSVEAAGNIDLKPSWNLTLSARKQLYPRQIILAELELAVKKAEQALADAKKTVNRQLEQVWQVILTEQKDLKLQKEQLAEKEADLNMLERKLRAGFVTEFEVAWEHLNIKELEIKITQKELAYLLSLLKFWAQCNYDLVTIVQKIMS